MSKAALVLVSHGKMAEETLKSAQMIVGNIDRAYTVSMDASGGLAGLNEKLKEVIGKIGDNGNIIVMVDLIGGTPSNSAAAELFGNDRIRLISGFNLGMVLEFATASIEDADELKNHLLEVGMRGIKDVFEEMTNIMKK